MGGTEKVTGNVIALSGGEVVSRLIAFLGTTYLARTLEPAGFGIISFATALFGYFYFTTVAGFNDMASREVARRPQEAANIAAGVLSVRLTLAVAALVALSVVAWGLHKPASVKLVVILTGLSFFSLALDTSWVYKGLERSRMAGLALILGQALYVGAVWMIVRGPADLPRVPLAQFFGEMGAALLLAIPLFRSGKINLEWREGWRILRGSWSLAITRLLRMCMTSFDLVLLGLLLGEREAGLYAAPYRICFLFLAVAAAIHSSYLPAITRAWAQSAEQAKAIAARSVGFSAAVAAPVLVGGILLAVPLLRAVFGPDYVAGAWAFRLLLLSMGFICFFGTAHNILLACGRLKDEMRLMAVAAGLNVGLNLIVIPRYGLVGAAAVTALTEGLVLMIALLTVARLGIGISLRPLWRPFLAAGMMGASLIALGPNSGITLQIGLGAGVYVITLGLCRGIPDDAQPHLRQIVSLAGELRRKLQRA